MIEDNTNYLKWQFADNALVELRAFTPAGAVQHGLFNDQLALQEAFDELRDKADLYTTVQRPAAVLKPYAMCSGSGAMTDTNISTYTRLVFDADPKRDPKTQSTYEQMEHARSAVTALRDHLTGLGWPRPAVVASGNGYHLIYRLEDTPNTKEFRQRLEHLYKWMDAEFGNEHISMDKKVRNPSRIMRLPGSLNYKGTPEAEPRPADVKVMPSDWLPVSTAQVVALAEQHKPEPRQKKGTNGHSYSGDMGSGDYSTLDIVRLFEDHGSYVGHLTENKHAAICPWVKGHSSSNKADCIIYESDGDGWPEFYCHHDSCDGKRIKDVMDYWGDADSYCTKQFGTANGWTNPLDAANGLNQGNPFRNKAGNKMDSEAHTTEAPEPESAEERKPFPLQALPDGMRLAVVETQNYVQCPMGLAVNSILAATAASAQHVYDIKRNGELTGPVSLFLLAIAASGERKSTIDKQFLRPFFEYQVERAAALANDIAQSKSDRDKYRAERDGLLNKIRSKSGSVKPADQKDLLRLRSELLSMDLAGEPQLVHAPEVIAGGDFTYEALTQQLHRWPSVIVACNEAGAIFGGHSMRGESVMLALSGYNLLWDGQPLSVKRASKDRDSFELNDVRATFSLMVQEETLRGFVDSSGKVARGQGFFARFLITQPESTIGTRMYQEPPAGAPHLAAHNRRVSELLELRADPLQTPRELLSLSDDGKKAWVAVIDALETDMRQGGVYGDLRDLASKAGDNIVRMAGLFHVYEGNSVDQGISADNISRAARVVSWYLAEANRVFGRMEETQEAKNAEAVFQWLVKNVGPQTMVISRRDLQRQVKPARLRNARKIESALIYLENQERVERFTNTDSNSPNKPKMIRVLSND